MPAAPAFTGFPDSAMAFFRGLAETQSRDWFLAHRAAYDEGAVAPMRSLLAELSEALAGRGLPLRGDPFRSVFRLNRDIRFSKDKRPYKTHIGATLTRDGQKLGPGLLYVHIDPAGSFTAAGFYRPEPPVLAALRAAIADDPAGFAAVEAALAAKGLAIEADGEALKRAPRGFEAVAEPAATAIRRKSHLLRQPIPPELRASPALVAFIAEFAAEAAPLLDWGWAAIDG